tara:strand:- start:7 stop:159 length:153 start_codon:yes stop_codon:yes gene_type:complete
MLDQNLNVLRRAMLGNHQQVFFIVRRRRAGQGPDLGVANRAGGEGLIDQW